MDIAALDTVVKDGSYKPAVSVETTAWKVIKCPCLFPLLSHVLCHLFIILTIRFVKNIHVIFKHFNFVSNSMMLLPAKAIDSN